MMDVSYTEPPKHTGYKKTTKTDIIYYLVTTETNNQGLYTRITKDLKQRSQRHSKIRKIVIDFANNIEKPYVDVRALSWISLEVSVDVIVGTEHAKTYFKFIEKTSFNLNIKVDRIQVKSSFQRKVTGEVTLKVDIQEKYTDMLFTEDIVVSSYHTELQPLLHKFESSIKDMREQLSLKSVNHVDVYFKGFVINTGLTTYLKSFSDELKYKYGLKTILWNTSDIQNTVIHALNATTTRTTAETLKEFSEGSEVDIYVLKRIKDTKNEVEGLRELVGVTQKVKAKLIGVTDRFVNLMVELVTEDNGHIIPEDVPVWEERRLLNEEFGVNNKTVGEKYHLRILPT